MKLPENGAYRVLFCFPLNKLHVVLELLLEANHFYARQPRAYFIRQCVHVGVFSK